jgi:hypothetical protein
MTVNKFGTILITKNPDGYPAVEIMGFDVSADEGENGPVGDLLYEYCLDFISTVPAFIRSMNPK